MTLEKLNYESVSAINACNEKRAIQSQNIFRSVVRKAQSRGMKVSTGKTNLLVVSDSVAYEHVAVMEDSEGNCIRSGRSMKILGFHMSNKPNVSAHVEALRRHFWQRYWVLFHLKSFGFSQEELCKVYKTIIRPVADYCSVVYNSMLTDEQDEVLERCQAHALRCIFGRDLSYQQMRERAGVTTLRQRRLELSDKFAEKCIKIPVSRAGFLSLIHI